MSITFHDLELDLDWFLSLYVKIIARKSWNSWTLDDFKWLEVKRYILLSFGLSAERESMWIVSTWFLFVRSDLPTLNITLVQISLSAISALIFHFRGRKKKALFPSTAVQRPSQRSQQRSWPMTGTGWSCLHRQKWQWHRHHNKRPVGGLDHIAVDEGNSAILRGWLDAPLGCLKGMWREC